ncbi:MAG: AmmeMemoRadiSam system radical SAM enzyme [Oscillospiraceae bacterium]|jgi:pyruvate formate lyase activating enzyme|nr:AmmeMemoRadiSam system radical SAM enzyme [Oscillospiraceae bacterium]MCI1990132.1 AmmeMemoRadiSam system radical SAM enzyme [Oscillospiraceae bacterium]MCI2034511.1 AmmeMemoRadiSam system radical SAM enzyme [Oscillospiraceae bacterium]
MSEAVCEICPHSCRLEEGGTGLCGARVNRNGTVVCGSYGWLTSIALDPIEKKPLRRFHPGSKILSVGSYGCNLRCPFCQNYEISMARDKGAGAVYAAPSTLAEKAAELRPAGNIGLAFTYNEPLISFEYVRDCAGRVRANGMETVAVTNGFIREKPLRELLPLLSAVNIDLKGFTTEFYRKIGGNLDDVKRTIALASEAGCHVEVTTLVIPGENDSPEEMDRLSSWLAEVSPEIPFHVTRFFPRYRMADRPPTPVAAVYTLAELARKHLRYVYEGNC